MEEEGKIGKDREAEASGGRLLKRRLKTKPFSTRIHGNR
jgi:hypothetical protein